MELTVDGLNINYLDIGDKNQQTVLFLHGWKGIDYMSGIFGYVGKGDCKQRIVQGLKSLSYRGAEMSGAAFRIGDDILSVKVRGGAENLSEKIVTDADC